MCIYIYISAFVCLFVGDFCCYLLLLLLPLLLLLDGYDRCERGPSASFTGQHFFFFFPTILIFVLRSTLLVVLSREKVPFFEQFFFFFSPTTMPILKTLPLLSIVRKLIMVQLGLSVSVDNSNTHKACLKVLVTNDSSE